MFGIFFANVLLLFGMMMKPLVVYLDHTWDLQISDGILLRLADFISGACYLSGDVCNGDGSLCAGSPSPVQEDKEDSYGYRIEKCRIKKCLQAPDLVWELVYI